MLKELQLPSDLPVSFIRTSMAGLTGKEAKYLQEQGKNNTLPEDGGKTIPQILVGNIFTFFNALNLLLGFALALVGSWRNMLFLGVVITNTGIAVFQEIKARNTIRKLKLLHTPKVHVIRDNMEQEIAAQEAVEGDLVVLRSGDQAVADGVVVSGMGFAMESLLTGESDAIPKQEEDWIYSGSYLTEGKLICQLVHVGQECYANRLTKEAKKYRKTESGLMLEMERLIHWDAAILLPLGILLFLKQTLIQKLAVTSSVPTTVAAMLGMIPEGLILLTSIAMAAGVIRLAGKHVLIQELYGIESLARVDTICLDKTGTLTSGKMKTEEILPVYSTETEKAKRALSRFLGAFDGNTPTLKALGEAVPSCSEQPICILPFSSERKKSAASFMDGTTLVLGAPEYVMEEELSEEIRIIIEEKVRMGRRVLMLAEAEGMIQDMKLPDGLRPLALCFLTDEIRPNAKKTVRYFTDQGVKVRVISGDNPITASRIAAFAGIPEAEKAIDTRMLENEEAIREACEKYTVFGRVTPEQKKIIIEALKAAGHTVAMTGDGVNDIPAMRAADCSIAMKDGADAARHAAQITLLKNDFDVVPEIVLEGRRVINNITRSASLFLVKTICSFLLSIFTLLLPGLYPFQPIQMTLVSACTVGVPGFFLALESSRERIQGDFLRTVLSRALPGGSAVALSATLAMMLTRSGWSAETCSTLATGIAGIIGILALTRISWPLNCPRSCILTGAAISFFTISVCFPSIFFLNRLQGVEWSALGFFAALAAGLYVMVWMLIRRYERQRIRRISGMRKT